MGIWNRLGGVINSYFKDLAGDTNSRLKTDNYAKTYTDPDYNAAYEELNDYLNRKKTYPEQNEDDNYSSDSTCFSGIKLPPEELRADFEYLGVSFGASAETCKKAYKKLLKLHHPDRHAGHEGNYKKATEKTAKINAAYDKIEKWRNN
jgi:DnaJ-domain-containing protein 1